MLRKAENCKIRVRIAAGAGSFSQKCCQKDSTLYEEETSSLMGELQTLQLNSKAYAMKCRIALAPWAKCVQGNHHLKTTKKTAKGTFCQGWEREVADDGGQRTRVPAAGMSRWDTKRTLGLKRPGDFAQSFEDGDLEINRDESNLIQMTKLEKSYWECDWIQLHSRCIFPVKPRTAHCLTCSLDPESWVHQPARTGLLHMTDLPEWVTKFLSAERRTFSAAYTSTDINCFSNSLSAFQELIIFLHSGIRSHLPFVSLQASRNVGFKEKLKCQGLYPFIW